MGNATKLCADCGTAPTAPDRARAPGQARAHPNAKYCAACRVERRTRPRSTLTPEQGALVREWAGKIPQEEIQQRLGVSKAAITRSLREHNVKAGHYNQYKPDVVMAICTAYQTLGLRRTQELFPDIPIRSIVERYKQFSPRQIRWTADQLIELARMAGLVSPTGQARWFGRPNAYEGSIKKVWAGHLRCSPHDLNGLAAHAVWPLCGPGTPAVLVKYQTSASTTGAPKSMVLWVDLWNHLQSDVDPYVRQAIEVMAQFQRWLHQTDTRDTIIAMIREREHHGDDHDDPSDERSARARASADGNL